MAQKNNRSENFNTFYVAVAMEDIFCIQSSKNIFLSNKISHKEKNPLVMKELKATKIRHSSC